MGIFIAKLNDFKRIFPFIKISSFSYIYSDFIWNIFVFLKAEAESIKCLLSK